MVSRVLIVEDDPLIREVMQRQLNSLGVNCYAVTNGEEAVELAEFFDLVLMDVQLPGISGLEATRKIRSFERERNLPSTVIVATTSSGDRSSCIAAGMDDYCQKPVMRADLKRILREWLAAQPERQRLLG
jgi:CheY-like chemotaxis protein